MNKQDKLKEWIVDEINFHTPITNSKTKAHNILEQMKEELEGFNSEIENELLSAQEENKNLKQAIYTLYQTLRTYE